MHPVNVLKQVKSGLSPEWVGNNPGAFASNQFGSRFSKGVALAEAVAIYFTRGRRSDSAGISFKDTAALTRRFRRGCSGRPCRRPVSSGPDVRSRG